MDMVLDLEVDKTSLSVRWLGDWTTCLKPKQPFMTFCMTYINSVSFFSYLVELEASMFILLEALALSLILKWIFEKKKESIRTINLSVGVILQIGILTSNWSIIIGFIPLGKRLPWEWMMKSTKNHTWQHNHTEIPTLNNIIYYEQRNPVALL